MRISRIVPILPLIVLLVLLGGSYSSRVIAEDKTAGKTTGGASAGKTGNAKTEGQPTSKTPDSKTSKAKTGKATEDAQSEKKEDDGVIQWFEKSVDSAAGWCAGKLGAVIFYEFGKKSVEHKLDGTSTDLEAFRASYDRQFLAAAKRDGLDPKNEKEKKKIKLNRDDIRSLAEENSLNSFGKLLKLAEDEGMEPDESDFELSLPKGTLTAKQAQALQKVLNQKFTAGHTREFTVKVRAEEDSKGVKAKVVRHGVSAVVLWLVLGAIFFTLRMGFINFRGFKHAVKVTAGKYDNPEDKGEVNHFQALTAALSATVGLGNIAGVAIAVMTGGPGATFWMLIAGILGMSSKFTECTLGQKYREVRSDGRIMGGAMYYLSKGLKEKGLGRLGAFLGVSFAVLCILASLGGGNAFQVNQSLRAVEQTIPALKNYHWLYGLIMAVLVGIVIIGGIRRIAATAEKIVPLMCGVYILACLWILGTNISAIPGAFQLILSEAFTPRAGYGGLLGVLIMGFRRAAFSNEAGVGSAAIAHSAAKTEYPVREGIVALLEPFIDTVLVCTMTALVIVITGAYANPEYAQYVADNNGAALTSRAMGEQIAWFPILLSVAVILFAYSTMISWSYYGERCWSYLFGDRASMWYRVIFLIFVFLGSIMSATNVLDLSDLMLLGMAFPNILGLLILSGLVKRDLDVYWKKLKDGEFDRKNE